MAERQKCVLYDRDCIDCGECEFCDLDPTKLCDNCGKCLLNYNLDYAAIKIDGIEDNEHDCSCGCDHEHDHNKHND